MRGIYKSFVRKVCLSTTAVGLSLGLAGVAQAASVGFTLVLSGDTNVPTLNLTNNSDTALLEAFSLSIGDTSKNFDAVVTPTAPSGGTFVLGAPDANLSGGARTDVIQLTFTDFDPTEFAQWGADVDRDSSNTVENYQTVLFNNGALANSIATATFGDGTILSLTLDDRSAASSYTFTTSINPVPIPAAAWLFGSALLGLGALKRKKA